MPQSVERPTLGFSSGHGLRGHEIELHVGLWAQWGVCLGFSLPPFPSAGTPVLALSHTVNKQPSTIQCGELLDEVHTEGIHRSVPAGGQH